MSPRVSKRGARPRPRRPMSSGTCTCTPSVLRVRASDWDCSFFSRNKLKCSSTSRSSRWMRSRQHAHTHTITVNFIASKHHSLRRTLLFLGMTNRGAPHMAWSSFCEGHTVCVAVCVNLSQRICVSYRRDDLHPNCATDLALFHQTTKHAYIHIWTYTKLFSPVVLEHSAKHLTSVHALTGPWLRKPSTHARW